MAEYWQVLRQTVREFGEDKAPRLAAALAYYTIFSMAPLLVIVLAIVGLVYGSEDARNQLIGQLESRVGQDAANLIGEMVQRTSQQGGGVFATIIGIITLLVGATTVFAQLQDALNKIWDVAADRSQGFRKLLLVRLEGLGMVLALGFVLLVSFALQAALNVALANVQGGLPGGDVVWFVLNQLLMIGVFAVVFGAIFMVLPDVDLHWRNVLRGAILTAVLFKIGEFLIGFYLGFSGVKSTYGAAGSLVVLLLWVYYSSQILLFGAEFTQVDTRRRQKEEPAPSEAATGS